MALSAQTAAKVPSPHRPACLPPISSPMSPLARRTNWRCFCLSQARKNYDHIPKQFRTENLPDGLMDNYKNVPEFLYGLPREQLNMFMSQNIPTRQASNVTPESITPAGFYNKFSNTKNLEERKNMKNEKYNFDMKFSMYRGGNIPDSPPPDLPSILLDSRIIFLGMPLYEAVTQLIISQMHYLNRNDSSRPIYLYINSTGIQDEKMEVVASENEAFALADLMDYIQAKVHTINIGIAYGQAAMLLSRGKKGNRLLLPNCLTQLYLPKIYKSSGPATDMWFKAKDFEDSVEIFLDLLSESTGKSKEEIAKDIRHVKYFSPEEAIEYGLADRIIYSLNDETRDRTNEMERRARKAMLEAASLSRGSVRPAGR